MQKRQYLFSLLLVIFVYISFTSLDAMLKKIPVSDQYYSLDIKGMNSRTKPPLFNLKENGVYFIHPAPTTQAKANFRFKENEKLLWHFSIQEGSPSGEILFIVKKNGDEFKKFIVNTAHDVYLDIHIKKHDKITIIADSSGSTAGDWGNLEISKYESNYILKLRLIPLLWVIFFIYLMSKGYIYIAFSSYFGFLLTLMAEKVTFGSLVFADVSVYIVFFFLLAFISILVYQELRIFKKFKVATLLKLITTMAIYAIPISFIIFFLIFDKPIDWNILFAVYQTNPSEAVGFIESFVPISYLTVIVLFTFILGYLFWHQESKERQMIERSLLMLIIILLIGFSSVHFLKVKIPNLIHNTFVDYNNQIERLLAFQEKRKTSKIKFSATKEEKGEVYVVVIGESLNKYNMGIYGHFRNTTPKQSEQVKKHNLQVFNNVYANAGNTMQTLSLALTEANQYNNKNFLESLSFIDIFNKAGFDTSWLSTQNVLGESNTIVAVIAQSSKRIVDLAHSVEVRTGISSAFDENTIEELKKSISTNKNTLFIVHIYGNHFRYKDRYPDQYSKYQRSSPFMLGTDKEKILKGYSDYDNSVYYNDYVISSLLDVVKNHGGVSSFLHFSDHGEAIARHRAHTSRPEGFTYEMAQIPLTAWLSPEYIKRYPETYKTFISHKDKLFSNDMIYDTILGLAHIKTDHYNAVHDLSSPKYHLDPKNATTLHGKLKYTASNNYHYWQKYNAKLLHDENLSNKIVIVNTDTVGKLNDAWRLGFRSFKLNLNYITSKKSFQAGTKKLDTEGNIIDLLSYFKIQKFRNLFLNFTNLTQSNTANIIARLEHIDHKLDIKQKTILIVSQLDLVDSFKQKGWKVALQDSKVLKNIPVDRNNLDYVIFNAKTYEKMGNSQRENNSIVNHSFNLANSKLHKNIQDIQYIRDSSVNFIFIDFTSVYDK